MNLLTARTYVRQFARNAGDSSMYDNFAIDRAIKAVADDFILTTKCTRRTDSLAITSGSSTIGALPTSPVFRAERIIRAWIPSFGRLSIIDHDALVQMQIDNVVSALPIYLAFDTATSGEVYPTPDASHTAKVQWLEPFTTWTDGGDDPGTLNLPDDYLRFILVYGATATLQHNEPEHKYASETWKKYLAFRDLMRGVGNLGAKVVQLEKGA